MSDGPSPERLDALARQAADRPPGDRQDFLERVCPDADLREAVWERLQAMGATEGASGPTNEPTEESADAPDPDAPTEHVPSDDLDEEAPSGGSDAPTAAGDSSGSDPDDASPTTSSETPFGPVPDRIGPWRLVGLIGEGGMGTVHFAERADGQFEQQVALKLLRHDLDATAQERFLAERQILAELQHPNIAHLLDGGVTDDGRPYFVMEYVDGTPLDTYCNNHSFGVPPRLHLFKQVCEAVAFSHRNLIVHRDLKPSNILVTEPDTDPTTGEDTNTGPQVKLLDFGIAKALEGAEGRAARTRTGESPMTPRYAAPEQVQGDPITTATDVYSLGVLLYELLTGTLPYDIKNAPVTEVAQVIATTDPTAPSEQVTTDPTVDAFVEETHGMTSDELGRALKGDLDVIVEKALRKEPDQRYTSAAELAQDLTRYLDGLPVEARAATPGYRLRRFVSRNRTAVMSATAAMIALVIGLGVAVWQAQVAAAERDRAQAAEAEAEQVISFLQQDLFENATPSEAKGDTLTVYELVDRGRKRLSELSGQPNLQARMFAVVGGVYKELSEYQTADSLLRRSVELQRSLTDSDRQRRLGEYLSERAGLKWERGRHEAADSLAQAALQQLRDADATSTHEYASAISLRGTIALTQKRLQAADSLFKVAERRFRTLNVKTEEQAEQRTRELASIRHNRGSIHYYQDKYARAASFYEGAMQNFRQLEGPNHPSVIRAHSAIGLMRKNQGDLSAAAAHLDTAVTRGRDVFGPRHVEMATFYNNLAGVYEAQERYEEADSLYRLALAVDEEKRGPSHPYVAGDLHAIGTVNQARERPKTALEAFAREVRLRRSNGPSVDLAKALYAQGTTLTELERYEQAEDRLQNARSVHAEVDAPDSSLTADLHSALATLYTEWGRPDQARRWHRRADSLSADSSSSTAP